MNICLKVTVVFLLIAGAVFSEDRCRENNRKGIPIFSAEFSGGHVRTPWLPRIQARSLCVRGPIIAQSISSESLGLGVPGCEEPSLLIKGKSDQNKYIRIQNSDDETMWDLNMDADRGSLSLLYTTNGWLSGNAPVLIDPDGVIYGNGAGLTNLNLNSFAGVLPVEILPSEALASSSQIIGKNGVLVSSSGSEIRVALDETYLYTVLLANIPPGGNLSMGSFTNAPSAN